MGFGAAIAQGVLRGVQGAGTSRLEQLKEEAKQLREDNLLKSARAYQTGERIAGQTYEIVEKDKDRKLTSSEAALTRSQQDEQFGKTLGFNEKELTQRANDAAAGRSVQYAQIAAERENIGLRADAIIKASTAEELRKMTAADKANEKKALVIADGFKAQSPSGELSVAQEVAVEAIRNGVDPKIFDKAEEKIQPELVARAMEITGASKDWNNEPDPKVKAKQVVDITRTLAGKDPEGASQFVEHMQAASNGEFSKEDLDAAVEAKKLSKAEALILEKYIPKIEEPKKVIESTDEVPINRGVMLGGPIDLSGFPSKPSSGIRGSLLDKRLQTLRSDFKSK